MWGLCAAGPTWACMSSSRKKAASTACTVRAQASTTGASPTVQEVDSALSGCARCSCAIVLKAALHASACAPLRLLLRRWVLVRQRQQRSRLPTLPKPQGKLMGGGAGVTDALAGCMRGP